MPNLAPARRTSRSGQTLTHRHPRVGVAMKAACAAALAWLLVQPFGGFVQDYPYYAPLGAAIAMSTSVVGSVRATLRTVAAILVGAAVALATRALPWDDAVGAAAAVATVVGVGTLLAGWRPLGEMGGWVPVAGLFVLILGGSDPWPYVVAYGGLTGVGALVGVAVNAAFPQLPLTPAALAQDRLRDTLATELERLAAGLDAEEPLSEDQWASVSAALDPEMRRVEQLIGHALEAQRGNWRAGRWAPDAERHHRRARAYQQLTIAVEEVVALVSDPRTPVHGDDEEAARLRASVAHALSRIAEMLRASHGEPATTVRATTEQAAIAVRQLKREVARLALTPPVLVGDRGLAAAAIAVGLERAVLAWR